ncbi:MAG: hypothetical protein OJF49_004481 [Ktedonobacterales bacterium]|jgi:hypothetical protein|nr:MAG: hypothetical protein OJF49_004481 [Ktedonobacterales bacterium]
MPTPTYRSVFTSHAHADNAVCARYADALRARGIDVWIDLVNGQRGHDLTSEIDRELRRRSAFLLMVTIACNASRWVIQERGAYNALMNTVGTHMVDGVERMVLPVANAAVPMSPPLILSSSHPLILSSSHPLILASPSDRI